MTISPKSLKQIFFVEKTYLVKNLSARTYVNVIAADYHNTVHKKREYITGVHPHQIFIIVLPRS